MEKYGSHSNQVIHLAERSQFTSLKFCEGALGRLDSRLNLCRRDAPQFSRESLLCVLSDQLKCWNKILIGANECGGQNHFYYSVSASVTMLALASLVGRLLEPCRAASRYLLDRWARCALISCSSRSKRSAAIAGSGISSCRERLMFVTAAQTE